MLEVALVSGLCKPQVAMNYHHQTKLGTAEVDGESAPENSMQSVMDAFAIQASCLKDDGSHWHHGTRSLFLHLDSIPRICSWPWQWLTRNPARQVSVMGIEKESGSGAPPPPTMVVGLK